jgi:hypothetical protein
MYFIKPKQGPRPRLMGIPSYREYYAYLLRFPLFSPPPPRSSRRRRKKKKKRKEEEKKKRREERRRKKKIEFKFSILYISNEYIYM